MLTWFQALMPKELKFFDLFSAHAEKLVNLPNLYDPERGY